MDQITSNLKLGAAHTGTGVDLDEYTSVTHKRILIIEDDPDTSFLIKRILILAGYDVSNALNGAEGLRKCSAVKPDLILLDLRMPEMDGWQTYGYLRQITNAPVIIISANGAKDDVVRALMNGVDDYMTKPFFNAEVVARVQTVLRRAGQSEEVGRLVFARSGLVLDFVSQEVVLKNIRILFTPKEFAVIAALAKHAPAIVRYQVITQAVWGEDTPEAHNRTKYLIYLIRRKLESAAPGTNLIQNVDRIGYRLNVDE